MNKYIQKSFLLFMCFLLVSCARDLSTTTYTSDSTLNIVLDGMVLSSRKVKVKESDKLESGAGTTLGAIGGGMATYGATNNAAAAIGGAVVGGVVGTLAQDALGTSDGIEYVVKVDKSKLSDDYYEGSQAMRNALASIKASGIITVVQAKEKDSAAPISEGSNVLVIISNKRTRIILNRNI